MGILWGYPQDFLWVWDGYADRNSVPTAALEFITFLADADGNSNDDDNTNEDVAVAHLINGVGPSSRFHFAIFGTSHVLPAIIAEP